MRAVLKLRRSGSFQPPARLAESSPRRRLIQSQATQTTHKHASDEATMTTTAPLPIPAAAPSLSSDASTVVGAEDRGCRGDRGEAATEAGCAGANVGSGFEDGGGREMGGNGRTEVDGGGIVCSGDGGDGKGAEITLT